MQERRWHELIRGKKGRAIGGCRAIQRLEPGSFDSSYVLAGRNVRFEAKGCLNGLAGFLARF